jgi:hypothetical protein
MEKKHLAINEIDFREQLRIQFLVSTLMIPLKKVSAILGLPESTLRQYVSEGRFFLPHRRVSRTIMVDVEDLVAWYCTNQDKLEPGELPKRLARYREQNAKEIEVFECFALCGTSPEKIMEDACITHGISHRKKQRAL